MTVQELIEKLSHYPGNLPVHYMCEEDKDLYAPVAHVYRGYIKRRNGYVDAVLID